MLLLLSASSYHVRSTIKLNLNFHKFKSHLAESSYRQKTILSSVLETSRISNTIENPDDDIDFSVIEEMGHEMMQLIVEAATLKSAPRQMLVEQDGMAKENE